MIPRLIGSVVLAWIAVMLPSLPAGAASVGPPVVIRTLMLHGNPVPLAVDEPNHHVFVLEAVHRAVYVLDSRDGRLLSQIRLPGQPEPTAVGVDPSRHRVLIGVIAFSRTRVPGPPSSTASIVTLDGRTLTIVHTATISHHPSASFSNTPVAVTVDTRTGHTFALRSDGAVIMLDTSSGHVLHYSWANANITGGVVNSISARLFVTTGGGMMEGPTTGVAMLNATTGQLLRRIAVAPPPSSSSVPVPPLGEFATLLGLDTGRGMVVVVGTNRGTSGTAVVELDASTGQILTRRAVYATGPGGVTAGPGVVDTQLGRVYLSTSVDARTPYHSRLMMLSEGSLGVLRTINVGGDVGSIGVDIHAHRIFAMDGHSGLLHVFDTWSGTPIRTVRIASAAAGTNAVSILISGPTHRAFIGNANGTLTVVNSSLSPT